jgi:hypothetical protein
MMTCVRPPPRGRSSFNGPSVPPVPLALEVVGDDEVGYVAGVLLRDFDNGDALDVVEASRVLCALSDVLSLTMI